MIEKLIKKNSIYKGRVLEFWCDDVALPNGATAKREYVVHPGACAVLPFVDDSNIVLVKQFRYVINQITYEIPAGKIDVEETPLKCAVRELEEETGYQAKKLDKMMSLYPSSAFSTELLHIFVAFDLQKGMNKPDEDEFVSTEIINFNDALKMVKSGKITDSKTIIAVLNFSIDY
ncbi:MAG: NUDIX hydrolase [Endomicrobium sp.]|jgi:ADP-ribose pyrophosphatase|uniref:NUDIX domain-containing protein n=1 Tax=Candidatus Endomicrobiellum cubanum TaxID=3242325 RepID=UPI0028199979|nr:NUDIX hydrolase [Endomicrobium sp.]